MYSTPEPVDRSLSRIVAMVSSPNAGVRDLAKLIESDAQLSARVLYEAASAEYFVSSRRPCCCVLDAVNLLGFDRIRMLALAGRE